MLFRGTRAHALIVGLQEWRRKRKAEDSAKLKAFEKKIGVKNRFTDTIGLTKNKHLEFKNQEHQTFFENQVASFADDLSKLEKQQRAALKEKG